MEHDNPVIEEAANRGDQLLAGKLVTVIEKHHDSGPGVPRSVVEKYIDELDERGSVDAEEMHRELDDHLANPAEGADKDAVYEVGDGRLSGYPPVWHEELAPDESLAKYVDVMTRTSDDSPKSAASSGVSKDDLLETAAVLSNRDRDDARQELKDLRAEGVLTADADQHPRAGVTLTEDVDFEKGDWDRPDPDDRSNE